MRFIDIAVAALIGTSAMTGLFALSPRQADAISHRLLIESDLRDALLSHVESPGVIILIQTHPQSVCEIVPSWSTSSLVFTATANGVTCDPLVPEWATSANLTVQTVPETVVLWAWKSAGG